MLCSDVHHVGEEVDRSVGDKRVSTVEVWENQRYYPFVGWSTKLLATDRWQWSDAAGTGGQKTLHEVPAPQGWSWVTPSLEDLPQAQGPEQALLKKKDKADKDGWFYRADFSGPIGSWYPCNYTLAVVRRRRHLRTVWQPLVTEEVIQVASEAMQQLLAQLPGGVLTGQPSPTASGKFQVRVVGCTFRIDELSTCYYDLRFGWSLATKEEREANQALSKVLDELYFDVSRRFNDFKMLCKRMDFAKLQYAKLPASGLGTTLLTKFGNAKSTDSEQKQRAKELPEWLNRLIGMVDSLDPSSHPGAPDAIEAIKLFCFLPTEDWESSEPPSISKQDPPPLPTESAMDGLLMIRALPTISRWLAYCFEVTMLRLTTGGTKGGVQAERQQAAAARRAAQAARVPFVQAMHAAMTTRTECIGARTGAHLERAARERNRLALQQSTEFVAGVDRSEDEPARLSDEAERGVQIPEFERDKAFLGEMENAHRVEVRSVDATIASISQEEQAFEHQVHQYILANMAVIPNSDSEGAGSGAISMPTSPGVGSAAVQAKIAEASGLTAPGGGGVGADGVPVPASMAEVGVLGMGPPPMMDQMQPGGSSGPAGELAMLRHKRATLQNKGAEKQTIFLEQGQHNQEAAEVFPALHTRVQEEEKMWAGETSAMEQEGTPRTEERSLYAGKVTAQEDPVDGVLSRQHARMEVQVAMDTGLKEREGMRNTHYATIGAVHTSIAGRVQPRAERNQIRDNMYRTASQRLQAQQSNPVRLFFCNDIGPVEVPADFENDVNKCIQMSGKNNEDLATLQAEQGCVRTHHDSKASDATVLTADAVGWYAYSEKVKQAEAAADGGALAFLDREFLSRLHAKASTIEEQTVAEAQRLEDLGTHQSNEAAVVADSTRTVAIDLEQLRGNLEGERPAFNDEHARNQGILATIANENAARAAKEAGLAAQLAAARTSVASLVGQLQQASSQFMSAANDSDVQIFLNIDMPAFLPHHRKRFQDLLPNKLEHVKEEKRNSKQRHHKGHEAPNKGPHAAAHTSLANAEEVVDKVARRIDRARRGDSKLRAAVGLATVVAVPLGVSVAQASVPLQPAQVHADDAWLAAHLGNQSLAMSELDAARQLAASDALVLASYSSKLDLARCFNSADDLMPRLRRQIGELRNALNDEEHRIKEKGKRHQKRLEEEAERKRKERMSFGQEQEHGHGHGGRGGRGGHHGGRGGHGGRG